MLLFVFNYNFNGIKFYSFRNILYYYVISFIFINYFLNIDFKIISVDLNN